MKNTLKTLLASTVITLGLLGMPALAAEPAKPAAPVAAVEQTASTRISLNSADADTLSKHLVGIGPAKAAAIVQWRDTNGRFTSVEQLLEIKGIGEATLNKNRARVTL
ncbi:MAG: ComEA family DNA-binding protein [Marinagarivorans sp.]|nr:ComEA family DNA-binding protein [Marinagarivorans sp.]